jgi:phosphoribosylglycinamide formyltransferase-1
MKRIAVFASGYGSNLQALIDFSKNVDLSGEIVLVFSDKSSAFALKRAQNHGIKAVFLDPAQFKTRGEFDEKIAGILEEEKIDLVVLAGYMLLIGQNIVKKFKNRIINIHPALLPSFKGTHGIKDAFNYGVKVTGVTVHFVDEGLDSGPIIMQQAVDVSEEDSSETLEEKIHEVEHKLYPLAVKYFCSGRLKIEGRKVLITQ